MIFKLTANTKLELQVTKKKTKTEQVYSYESETGAKLQFHSHPTRAFVWVFVVAGCNDAGLAVRNKFLNAWITLYMDAINADGATGAEVPANVKV